MDQDDSRSLLKSVLGFFARKQPETSTPTKSVGSQALDAWVRTDAFLQHESDEFGEIDHKQVARTLSAFEDVFQYHSDRETDSDLHRNIPYPKLQAVRRMIQCVDNAQNGQSSTGTTVRVSKRKRENDAAIHELSRLESDVKRRRVLPPEEPNAVDKVEEPEADSIMLMRKHLMSLDNALRTHWVCVCRKCSGLSVRLSLPLRKKDFQVEPCFEVFFGVRSLLATSLQEAKITVKDVIGDKSRSVSEPGPGILSNFAHICQNITESLDQRNCLHLALENGLFKRLRPQPKTFGDVQVPRTVSLSSVFERQQELRGGQSVLPLKGRRILAVTLARALLPFLETSWVQPSFNYSKIQFFQPLQEGELPDITKPFLAMEHIPIVSSRTGQINTQADCASSKHMIHPNASVLALGILLCELHYCTPVELRRNDTEIARNVNTDYYTSLDILKDLEVDAGFDYYLATKACLQWEYYPAGEPADFEDASVQRLFYQNVVKRLESEIFKSWRLSLEDIAPLDPRENGLCWGQIGRDIVRQHTSRIESTAASNGEPAFQGRSTSDSPSLSYTSRNSNVMLQMPTQLSQGLPIRSATPSKENVYFFDASHQAVSTQETTLSQKWMDNLLSSIYHHVDSFDLIETRPAAPKHVRLAILDSGFDPANPLLLTDDQQLDPRIKDVRSFVSQTEPLNIQDKIGHGTHALGLLLSVATSAEIYIAKIASRETMDRDSYDAIAKAINYSVTDWNVDIISMSFGIREYHEPMKTAISNALHNQTLMFAAASNDGANLGRAFPAKYPGVFCIHSTDGNGNPSAFNPTADDKDVNFSLLGEQVYSHWPAGMNGHSESVNAMSGTSVATPIAAGLAASLLSFVHQQDQNMPAGTELLGQWLKDVHSMDAVLKSMVRQRRGAGYDYITPHTLFDVGSSRSHVYSKIKDIRDHMYD